MTDTDVRDAAASAARLASAQPAVLTEDLLPRGPTRRPGSRGKVRTAESAEPCR